MNHEEKAALGKGLIVWLATVVGLSISELGSLLAAIFTALLIIDHIWRRYVKKIYHGTFLESDVGDIDK